MARKHKPFKRVIVGLADCIGGEFIERSSFSLPNDSFYGSVLHDIWEVYSADRANIHSEILNKTGEVSFFRLDRLVRSLPEEERVNLWSFESKQYEKRVWVQMYWKWDKYYRR